MGTFSNATYGSQTRQIGSWYQDEAWFVSNDKPWFGRGGVNHHGLGSGLLMFSRGLGSVLNHASYRIVLAL